MLALGVAWLLLAGAISGRLARVLSRQGSATIVRVLLFFLVLVAPFADELIGSWQFRRLCDGEAKVWISPNAREVVAAHSTGPDFVERQGLVIPVSEQPIVYVDAKTGQPFYTLKAFHTPGGIVMRMGLNLGHSRSCWPKNWTSRENGIDIDNLLKRGNELKAYWATYGSWNDPRDPVVTATDAVASGRRPILRVLREEGPGGWQLYDDGPLVGKPVVLRKDAALKLDPSLSVIADLPVRWEATRRDASSPWVLARAR